MQTKVSGFHPPSPRPLLAQVSAGLPRGLARLSQVKTPPSYYPGQIRPTRCRAALPLLRHGLARLSQLTIDATSGV